MDEDDNYDSKDEASSGLDSSSEDGEDDETEGTVLHLP